MTNLEKWIVVRARMNPQGVCGDLLREVERLLADLERVVRDLHYPPEKGWDALTDRGRRAARTIEALLRAVDQLLAGASLEEIELPEWMMGVGDQLPLPEAEATSALPTERERPWEALNITQEQWERPLREILEGIPPRMVTSITHFFGRHFNRPNVRAGEAFQALQEGGWRPSAVRGIGKGSLEWLGSSFANAGYPVPEPEPKGLPRGRSSDRGLGGAA